MFKTILAIGGHIGDMELTAGGLMATNAVNGGKNITLALTAGERGNPLHLTITEYRKQKIAEANQFMKMMNGEALILKYADGELPDNEEVRHEVAEIIVKYKPDIIVTHWHSSMHKDHNRTHYIVQDAQFIAGVIGNKEGIRHYAPVYFCENWEDDQDFDPHIYVDINSKDFAYYDYYTSLARCRGALSKKQYAECFNVLTHDKKEVRDEL